MPKLKFQATKMSDAHVSHISLVERGANRIPFKVIKEETGMKAFAGLDLGGLFSRKAEKTVEEPQVIAVATMNGDTLDAVKKSLTDAGFAVENMQEMEDGSVIFKQEGCSDEALADGVVVRLSENIAIVTKGFSPYNMDVTADGVTFADQCAAKGFYPGISAVMETLSDSIRSVVYAAKTPAEAKVAVAKLFSEAAAYTGSFVASLPVKAFKLEADVPVSTVANVAAEAAAAADAGAAVEGEGADGETVEKAAKPGKKVPPEGDPEGGAEDGMGDEPDPMKGKGKGCKKDEGEDGAAGAAEPAAALTIEAVSDMVATKVSEATGSLVAKLEELLGKFDGVQTTVAALTERTEKAEAALAESEKVVKAALVVGSDATDAEPSAARKSESSVGRVTDTAFMPRRTFPRR